MEHHYEVPMMSDVDYAGGGGGGGGSADNRERDGLPAYLHLQLLIPAKDGWKDQ